MEFIADNKGNRVEIPDAVIAASDNRDLVDDYVKATPADREKILALALVPGVAANIVAAPAAPPAAKSALQDAEEKLASHEH